MQIRFQNSPKETSQMNTQELRDNFLLDGLMQAGTIQLTYSHYDRMIIGGVVPTESTIALPNEGELKANFFLERREMGIINIGGAGKITVDGEAFELNKLDCLYIGKGKQAVSFEGAESKFIFFSCPAHAEHPVQMMKSADATPAEMGSSETANHRTINKYVHPDGLKSCQLMLGVTNFKPGSIWNTMPSHLHDRRMEAYFYFDLPEAQRIIHFMGEPHETRHMFLNNEEGIISPSWSIHSGVATAAYSFIWAMAGENSSFADMDFVNIMNLK
jgi:4-deoxy-L-threo-5-hexosulose-uronate ketol-isomerase